MYEINYAVKYSNISERENKKILLCGRFSGSKQSL